MNEGDKAPDFTLPATGGSSISLSDFLGKKHVVVYFYPKDNTFGCTSEATQFRDAHSDFEAAEAVVLGISTDSMRSHELFAAKLKLTFPLLSDSDKQVVKLYGAWNQKTVAGITVGLTARMTFAIDKAGVIRKIWPKVTVDQHAADVLATIMDFA